MSGQPKAASESWRALGLALAQFRSKSTLNQTDLGRMTHYSRTSISHIEAGRQFPEREFWEIADSAYGADGALVAQYDEVCENEDRRRIMEIETARSERRRRAANHTAPYRWAPDSSSGGHRFASVGSRRPSGPPIDLDYVEGLHRDIGDYVRLDQQHGGGITSQLIVQGFRQARRRIETSELRPGLVSDTLSAVAEIAEVAGWSLYDAQRHAQAQELNTEALDLARACGDRSLELFVLQNISMHAGDLGRGQECLDVVSYVLSMGKLSPRVEALFRLREARALAQLGADLDAHRQLALAKNLYAEGVRDDDPTWAWWVDEAEFAWHEGTLTVDIGRPAAALDYFEAAANGIPERRTRTHYSYRASALLSQVTNRSWSTAEPSMLALLRHAGYVGSRRGNMFIEQALGQLHDANAPGTIRDLAHELRVALSQAP
jgi:tetratricopeptide (TPR) repeat protein/DNA-binding XRE family transcriptional regulator